MRWFGQPWPTPERRAPVCDDDTARVPVPIGRACGKCGYPFSRYDRGVLIPLYDLTINNRDIAYHAACFLKLVIGERLAGQVVAQW